MASPLPQTHGVSAAQHAPVQRAEAAEVHREMPAGPAEADLEPGRGPCRQQDLLLADGRSEAAGLPLLRRARGSRQALLPPSLPRRLSQEVGSGLILLAFERAGRALLRPAGLLWRCPVSSVSALPFRTQPPKTASTRSPSIRPSASICCMFRAFAEVPAGAGDRDAWRRRFGEERRRANRLRRGSRSTRLSSLPYPEGTARERPLLDALGKPACAPGMPVPAAASRWSGAWTMSASSAPWSPISHRVYPLDPRAHLCDQSLQWRHDGLSPGLRGQRSGGRDGARFCRRSSSGALRAALPGLAAAHPRHRRPARADRRRRRREVDHPISLSAGRTIDRLLGGLGRLRQGCDP